MNSSDLLAILPLIVLAGWACVLLLVDLFIPKERKGWTALLAAAGLLVALILALFQRNLPVVAFNGMVSVDGFANFLMIIVLGAGLIGIALAKDYLRRTGIERGEYYSLLLFSICGMILMAMAADLILVFLALELLSIPLYVLAGFARPRLNSEEASMKYFLLGAFAGGFVVYGVALVFGATGSTRLTDIVAAIEAGSVNLTLLAVGAALGAGRLRLQSGCGAFPHVDA